MPRRPLNRDRVLEAAVRLADDGGIDSLSMRRLARKLGVEAMSLYNHVGGKADLVDGITDLVVSEIELPEDVEPWDEAIRRCAVSAHDTFIRHPWACSLVMGPSATRTFRMPRMRYMEWLLARLRAAGFSPELTYHAYHALDSHIVGFTLWQLGHMEGAKAIADGKDFEQVITELFAQIQDDFPYLAEHAEQHRNPPAGKGEFEFGLDLILDGLRRARDS
jgi:AcrR family transcriptional regulator